MLSDLLFESEAESASSRSVLSDFLFESEAEPASSLCDGGGEGGSLCDGGGAGDDGMASEEHSAGEDGGDGADADTGDAGLASNDDCEAIKNASGHAMQPTDC